MTGDDGGADGWPAELRGVTESVVTTLGPNGLWNAAALGLRVEQSATERANGLRGGETASTETTPPSRSPRAVGAPVTARTWGNTRTRRNFHRQGGGVVQFVDDPVVFVEAALSIHEVEEPVLDDALAWVEVETEQVGSGEEAGTRWEEWELNPVESEVRERVVPTINRGFAAVVEATVAASRLGVDGYDDEDLRERLEYFEDVVERCGGERERAAMARVAELTLPPDHR